MQDETRGLRTGNRRGCPPAGCIFRIFRVRHKQFGGTTRPGAGQVVPPV